MVAYSRHVCTTFFGRTRGGQISIRGGYYVVFIG